MSTRSDIIIKDGENQYRGIYCHWDGYPSYNGRILLENYTTQDAVDELIQEGNLSELHGSPQACVSYHRWRGEAKNIKFSSQLSDLVQQDYSYLFEDGKWYWCAGDNNWSELTTEVCEEN